MRSERYTSVPKCKGDGGHWNGDDQRAHPGGDLEVLARSGARKLSLSDVAATAGVSRPTLYRWFPSKEALLEAFGVYEQQKYDAGIAEAVAGLDGEARLEAVLRFIVEFQHTYSLRRIVDVEPEHVVHQMNRVMPIMRDRLLPSLPGSRRPVVATVVTRIALSHALIPDDDPELFYAELRHAAGLDQKHEAASSPATPVRPTPAGEGSMNPKWHRRLTQVFLVANSMFWLPWGLVNLIRPKSWSGEVIPGIGRV